ncbi:hypothetical protein BGZ90_010056 [Linnemannia elongata]|nr:hypothetical protein BGZ90_010056 [Linnemannia elongata]
MTRRRVQVKSDLKSAEDIFSKSILSLTLPFLQFLVERSQFDLRLKQRLYTLVMQESVMEHPTTWPDADSVDAIAETDSNAVTNKKIDNLCFKSPETSQQ